MLHFKDKQVFTNVNKERPKKARPAGRLQSTFLQLSSCSAWQQAGPGSVEMCLPADPLRRGPNCEAPPRIPTACGRSVQPPGCCRGPRVSLAGSCGCKYVLGLRRRLRWQEGERYCHTETRSTPELLSSSSSVTSPQVPPKGRRKPQGCKQLSEEQGGDVDTLTPADEGQGPGLHRGEWARTS